MAGRFKSRVFKSRKAAAREIDDELGFHLELLTQTYLRKGLSPEDAQAAAVSRFGNFERTSKECLVISMRAHPLLIVLKSFLLLVFLVGIMVRILGSDSTIRTLGQLLIAVPILSRLLLYVRSLSPLSFSSKPDSPSTLRLNESVRQTVDR
jgi:hypothetical protein